MLKFIKGFLKRKPKKPTTMTITVHGMGGLLLFSVKNVQDFKRIPHNKGFYLMVNHHDQQSGLLQRSYFFSAETVTCDISTDYS